MYIKNCPGADFARRRSLTAGGKMERCHRRDVKENLHEKARKQHKNCHVHPSGVASP
jgi:hypothetical protein